MSGQCIMDQLGRKSDLCVKEGLYLSYNRSAGKVDISLDQPKFEEQGWKTYDKLFFEHSDTCPSKHFRERQEKGLPVAPLTTPVKMAVCCYVLDKHKNLMLTKRPDHLKIFPSVWVLPGGIVEFQESLEMGVFRELEEEVGLTLEFQDDDPSKKVIMTSPMRFD